MCVKVVWVWEQERNMKKCVCVFQTEESSVTASRDFFQQESVFTDSPPFFFFLLLCFFFFFFGFVIHRFSTKTRISFRCKYGLLFLSFQIRFPTLCIYHLHTAGLFIFITTITIIHLFQLIFFYLWLDLDVYGPRCAALLPRTRSCESAPALDSLWRRREIWKVKITHKIKTHANTYKPCALSFLMSFKVDSML